MASSLSKRMRRMESKKSHSWWWDSHISPKNSRWLQENLEEMDQSVKRMLKLIEEDADSFAQKAELYFQKRPELVALVEEFYRRYRALAERYDHVTGELKKNIPSDLQSQGSGVSDVGSEPPSSGPSPDAKPARAKSGPRAAGFDIFLGSYSDLNSKEGDESSNMDSESESDDSSVNNYSTTQSNSEELRRRIVELEAELLEMKEKLQLQQEATSQGCKKCDHEVCEEELRVAKEAMERAREEIVCLKIELRKYETLGDSHHVLSNGIAKDTVPERNQENISDSEGEVGLAREIRTLEEEVRSAKEKLRESEEEVASLRQELTNKSSSVQNLQDQLKSAQKEVSGWENRVEREKREVSQLQDRIVRYKTNLSERDQEIRVLKESICNANKALAEENEQLQAEMTRMAKERAYLQDNLKEMDLRCQSLDEELRRLMASKSEMEVVFGAQIEQLKTDIGERDELNAKIAALDVEMKSKDHHLHQLHLQHVELILRAEEAQRSANELRATVKELEIEVERKQETILAGAEEKREAIRQLCFSIEHYRSGYHELRRAVAGRPLWRRDEFDGFLAYV